MKRILMALFATLILTGCAASAFKTARANANNVKNGMTLQHAIAILGSDPSHLTANKAQWRRGNAQVYNGMATGAIEYQLKDGIIVGIPEGGVFSAEASKKHAAEEWARIEKRNAERAAQALEEREKLAAEISAETQARASSFIVCNDKATCAKIFALAQIYVAKHSDQKIQVATDTIIETYNPTDSGNIGMSVIKTPQAGATEIVSISPICKEKSMNDEETCRAKRTIIYAGFRPFVESNLRQ